MDTQRSSTSLPKSVPRDIFLHLLNITAFYVSAISYISLLINYINVLLPDPVNYSYGSPDSIFWATAVLLVAFPTNIFTTWLLERDFRADPEKRELKVRKWLIYATLFVSAVTMLGDTATFIYNFLRGELTLRFFLKVLVVLIVAAAVFGYYYWELRRKESDKKTWLTFRMLALISGAVILLSVIAGFIIVGTPAQQRARRLDETRTSDLSQIQNQAINYWVSQEKLPNDMGTLQQFSSGYTLPRDPDSSAPYEYRKTGNLLFEVCANFQSESREGMETGYPQTKYIPPPVPAGYPYPAETEIGPNYWHHGIGRTCFARTIDPKIYKPQPSPTR